MSTEKKQDEEKQSEGPAQEKKPQVRSRRLSTSVRGGMPDSTGGEDTFDSCAGSGASTWSCRPAPTQSCG